LQGLHTEISTMQITLTNILQKNLPKFYGGMLKMEKMEIAWDLL